MYRPPLAVRKFSLRGLFVASALASLGLPLGREACGIGGSAIQPTYTPRETVGAAPTVSLISSKAPAPAAESVTASGTNGAAETNEQGSRRRTTTRHITSADEGNGTTRKRRKRKGPGKADTTAVVDNSKGGKDYKQSPPMVAPVAMPQFSISTGFETRYIYHGLDIISFNSVEAVSKGHIQAEDSGIAYTNLDASYKGLHFGVSYLNSIERVIPLLQYSDKAVGTNRERYFQEVDVDLDYTVAIVANILDATLGYNSFIYPNNDFKGTGYQSELLFRLAYKQIPYVTPSFTFYHDFSEFHNNSYGDLNGSLVEFRLDGAIPIIKKEHFSVAIAPYFSSLYNIDYLKYNDSFNRYDEVGGFSYLETGIKLPIGIGKRFTVTPYGNYGLDLTASGTTPINSHNFGIYGETTRFWGGVTVTCSF